ncbi:MAG: antibiotic biosynthesis monooxygenase, partial [Cytophagales bacterium]|nr:antibiotic biosynthesis monooxygenase [Cytophagales bacterium]
MRRDYFRSKSSTIDTATNWKIGGMVNKSKLKTMHLIGKSMIVLSALAITLKERTMNTNDRSTTSIEYIRYTIDAGRHDRFVEDYREAVEYLQASRYCLGYELSQGEEEPSNFILRIEWTSTEDHLQGFRKS